MAAHRYWRIKITADSGWGSGGCSLSEVEMAESQGGSNQCSGGTAIASGDSGASWVPSRAFDGSASTSWDHEPGSFTDLWIGYDFGSGVTKDIVEVRMRPRAVQSGGKPFTLRAPGAFDVQYSDDGSSWTTYWSVAYPSGSDLNRHGYSIGALLHFTKPSAYSTPGKKRWRVKITSNSAGTTNTAVAVQEMEMYAVPGGANVATGGTAFADSEWDSGSPAPSLAFDGTKINSASAWIAQFSSSYQMPKWLGYAFPSAVNAIESIQIWPRDTFANSQSPVDIVVQYSEDTVTWTDYWSGTFGTWSEDTPQTLSNSAYVAGRRRQMLN